MKRHMISIASLALLGLTVGVLARGLRAQENGALDPEVVLEARRILQLHLSSEGGAERP